MKKIYILILTGICIQNTLFAGNFSFNLRRAQRRIQAHTIKSAVSTFDEIKNLPIQNKNGDEQRYSDKRGSFNKVLQHKSDGFPDTGAFASLVFALDNELPTAFDAIQLGNTRRLVNPQGSLVFSLVGNDSWINPMPAAPLFSSAEIAAEMVEDYWSFLVRDILFSDFDTDGVVGSAVTDLNTLSAFTGPKENGQVTRGTFLRGSGPGELVGPYISQFLYLDIPFGAMSVKQQFTVPDDTAIPKDFITSIADYLTVITGGSTGDTIPLTTARYIITPRDLTHYVHNDFPALAANNAALILNSFGIDALDKGNPYLTNRTQDGFVTFGINNLMALIQTAASEGIKTAWYQKWQVHRRLRPEEFGFYVEQQITGNTDLGINSELINSAGLSTVQGMTGTYLLPQAYPEGSPAHPAYPAGHAVFIGAAVTILKAWFNEDFILSSMVTMEPTLDGSALMAAGIALSVGGELNKLASNIAIGRNIAGVHYRSDGWQGLLLGEKVAIDVLNNYAFLFNENFTGFSLTTFEGNKITVGAKRIV